MTTRHHDGLHAEWIAAELDADQQKLGESIISSTIAEIAIRNARRAWRRIQEADDVLAEAIGLADVGHARSVRIAANEARSAVADWEHASELVELAGRVHGLVTDQKAVQRAIARIESNYGLAAFRFPGGEAAE